jgi:hypothetical protein
MSAISFGSVYLNLLRNDFSLGRENLCMNIFNKHGESKYLVDFTHIFLIFFDKAAQTNYALRPNAVVRKWRDNGRERLKSID